MAVLRPRRRQSLLIRQRLCLRWAGNYAPLVSRTGLLPEEQVDGWLAEQSRAMEEGTFFAACNYYAVFAKRPADRTV